MMGRSMKHILSLCWLRRLVPSKAQPYTLSGGNCCGALICVLECLLWNLCFELMRMVKYMCVLLLLVLLLLLFYLMCVYIYIYIYFYFFWLTTYQSWSWYGFKLVCYVAEFNFCWHFSRESCWKCWYLFVNVHEPRVTCPSSLEFDGVIVYPI